MSKPAAGQLNSYVFLAAIVFTPIFGLLFDRPRWRGLSLLGGGLMLLPVFPILAWTDWSPWIANVLLGLSYSLVPAVMWPCVTRIVPPERLGTAFGLAFMIQNAGLTLANPIAGALNDWSGASAENPAGYGPMLWFFAVLASAAVVFAILLHRDSHEL